MKRAMESGERIPIGVLYEKEQPTYYEKHRSLKDGQVLAAQRNDPALIDKYMREMV